MRFPGELNLVLYTAGLNIFTECKIPNRYFWNCKGLTDIDLSNVIEIGNSAFQSCSNLRKVTLSNSLKSIGYYTFEDCISLERIDLPHTLESIDCGAFNGCENLKYVNYSNSLEQFKDLLKEHSAISYFPSKTIIQCLDVTVPFEDIKKEIR